MTATTERTTAYVLRWATAFWVLFELISLRLGWLDRFFFDTLHAQVQGIDYYSLPKAWLNLASGRSLYGTFDPPAYGPHFTWYLAHPLFALLGAPLSHLRPEDSYGVFTMVSLAVMAAAAALLAQQTSQPVTRAVIWLLLLGAFPTFDMLYVGNVQAFTVLGLTLSLVGMLRLSREQPHATAYVFAGLLLSLFTKPVVLPLLPLLLLLRPTRRVTVWALVLYAAVSLLWEVVPTLNPEAVGLHRVLWLAVHPGFVQSTMNIYNNHMVLTPDMRDNSIHWFNLVAQAQFRLHHIDVFSLPVFLDTILGRRTPGWLYLLPSLAVLVLSFLVVQLKDMQHRHECALLLSLAASMLFLVTYPTVWEYQYTAVLPAAAILLLLRGSAVLRPFWKWSVALSIAVWLPSLYFLTGSQDASTQTMTLVRLDRVVPVTLLVLLLLTAVARATLTGTRQAVPVLR